MTTHFLKRNPASGTAITFIGLYLLDYVYIGYIYIDFIEYMLYLFWFHLTVLNSLGPETGRLHKGYKSMYPGPTKVKLKI